MAITAYMVVIDVFAWPQATFPCVLIALTEGKGPMTSSYTDSMCVLLSLLFISCRSQAALIFVLLLIKVTTITIMKTTTLTIKAACS